MNFSFVESEILICACLASHRLMEPGGPSNPWHHAGKLKLVSFIFAGQKLICDDVLDCSEERTRIIQDEFS